LQVLPVTQAASGDKVEIQGAEVESRAK